MPRLRHFLLAVPALGLLAGCATAPAVAPDAVADPFEVQNRQMHALNKGVDRAVLRPASRVWGGAVPPPVRRVAVNAAENLDTPGHVLNDLLQGEVDDAVHNLFRFAINSTLGIAGLFDPATSMGLEARESDFGQTLHVWGAGEGVYVELPVFGPRTERDAWGTAVDIALNPARVLLPAETPRLEARAVELLDARHSLGSTIDGVLYDSADSYAQSRSIYLQNRRFFLAEGQSEVYFDPYDEFLEE